LSRFNVTKRLRLSLTGSTAVSGDVDFVTTAVANAFTLTGPTTGTTGLLSTFTVTPNGTMASTVVVTPAATNAGSVAPASLTFASGSSAAQTFTVTRAADGVSSVSISNNGGLSNFGTPITYTSGSAVNPFTVVETGNIYATLQAAINAASAGDTITGVPGTYIERVSINKSLTIKSSVAGQKVVLDASTIKGGGVVSITAAATVVLEDLELYGNKGTYGQFYVGLYVFVSGVTLTARRCKIHENGNGLATSASVTSGTVLMENCEIANNGEGQYSLYHNVYVNFLDSLTLRGCWVHNTNYRGNMPAGYEENSGHLVKARSKALVIEGCRLTMEIVYSATWGANRCVDYSNGGDLTIRGCLIEYLTNQNGGVGQAISWGVEGANGVPGTTWDRSVWKVNIQQNTIVSRTASGTDWLWMGVGCSGDSTNNTNFSVVPAPTEYNVSDNVLCGWTTSPPRVKVGPTPTFDGIYALNTSLNTYGSTSLLTSATTYDYSLVTSVTGSQNWTAYQYWHQASTIVRSDSTRGAVPAGINFAALPLQTWTEITNSAFESAVKPTLDAAGATIYSYGSDGVSAAITNYNGMAWDYVGGRGWATGGGHDGGSDNSVFLLNMNTMKWSVDSIGTEIGKDGFTAQDADLYSMADVYSFDGTLPAWGAINQFNPYKRAFPRSSTGFAVNTGGTFSTVAYKEVPGPAGAFANQAEYDAFVAAPQKIAFPAIGNPLQGDIMFDGRPATRHWYGGQFYSPTRGDILYAVRAMWRYTPGVGWVNAQTSYTIPQYNNTENVWFQYDEVNDVLYKGGCGSDCYVTNYFFYGGAVQINLDTLTETPVTVITNPTSTPVVVAGESQITTFKAGRWIGGIYSATNGWRFNLDDSTKQKLTFTGTGYSGNTSDGNASVYIPTLGKMWLFDTHTTSLPCWEYDIDAAAAGGPNGTYTVAARTKTFTNSAALPATPGPGLVYNRLTYWPQKKVLVYVPNATSNVWVCRVE
jgi:hypothetical protein